MSESTGKKVVCELADAMETCAPREQRIACVHAWQRQLGMEPRDDSKLTQLYADGHVCMHPAEVARELLATDYIYKHTLYGEVIEAFLRRLADRLRARHALTWTATWNIVRFYGPIALKLMCLSATGERIPDRMPPS